MAKKLTREQLEEQEYANRRRRMADRTKLNAAFRLMRKAGLLAMQNYQCCSNCGGYALTTKAEDLVKSGKRTKDSIKGCCFYHRQDAEDRDQGHPFYLRYGDMDSTELDVIGLSTEVVGKMVCECLDEAGVSHSWDGNPGQCIQVTDW